jgi:response regulator of citrate/malate metabolism
MQMTTVLIVEDDLLVADLLQEQLEVAGFSVSGIARTTKEAEDLVPRVVHNAG